MVVIIKQTNKNISKQLSWISHPTLLPPPPAVADLHCRAVVGDSLSLNLSVCLCIPLQHERDTVATARVKLQTYPCEISFTSDSSYMKCFANRNHADYKSHPHTSLASMSITQICQAGNITKLWKAFLSVTSSLPNIIWHKFVCFLHAENDTH